MKPRLFIGSSVESLNIAYAVQEGLELYSEATVWTQGIFELSKYTMESLLDALDEADFGLFVFAPDDITKIRDKKFHTVRDNVIFELGLFIGSLGRERSFIIIPRNNNDFHLPTNLLGITPATFDADRQDENYLAALGPACNRIRRLIEKFGVIKKIPLVAQSTDENESNDVISDPNDCISILESWMGCRPSGLNTQAIKYREVDRELGFIPGLAEKHIEEAAKKWNYSISRKGKDTILFK
jgi:hypothetical protein